MEFYKALEILMEDAETDGVDCLTAGRKYGHGNACEVETALFLFGLAVREKPLLVIQSGTHWGFDTGAIALGLQFNGIAYPHLRGHLVTVDVNDYDAKGKVWDRIGVTDVITQIVGNAEDVNTYRHAISRPVDHYAADADHSGEALLREFHAIRPFLNKKRAIFSTHDSRLDERLAPAIQEILSELRKMRENGQGWLHINHFFMRNLRGLDFIILSNETI